MIHHLQHQGNALILITDSPDWTRPPNIKPRIAGRIETGLTARENRSPAHHELRHEITLYYSPEPDDLAAWQAMLAAWEEASQTDPLANAYIAIPMPMDRLTPANWPQRIYTSDWTVILPAAGEPSIVGTATLNTAALPADTRIAPLYVGRFKRRPPFTPASRKYAQASITLVEESPWTYRLTPHIPPGFPAIPLDWPAAIAANWHTAPEDSIIDSLAYTQIGNTRITSVEGQEGRPRRVQKFTSRLEERDQIRTLLAFFLSRKGRIESFTTPWLLIPGADTAATPHATRARFADDSLTFAFHHDGAADVRILLQQVPWETGAPVAGETPAQPAEAFLYTFTLRIPGEANPITWRYTDWASNITWEGQTWLGDTTGLIEHDSITQTADLSDPATKITLSANVPQNPVALIASGALDAPLHIDILACVPHTAAGVTTANSITPLYTGDVAEVSADGRKLTATTRVLGGLLENKAPRFPFSDTCNHRFCGPGCNQIATTWTLTGVIDTQVGSGLTLKNIANPNGRTLSDNFYARGILISAAGSDWEIRQIISNTQLAGNKMLLTLRSPLRNAPANLVVSFRPDCAGTPADCDARGNYINFGGHPHIGPDNLSLPSYNTSEAMGKK